MQPPSLLMMELSQPGPRRVYCVQDTYPKWSNTTVRKDRLLLFELYNNCGLIIVIHTIYCVFILALYLYVVYCDHTVIMSDDGTFVWKGGYKANNADFESFLKDINPSKSTIDEASRLHRNLREHLRTCDSYKNTHVDTYLSGSYAKQTFIRPKKDSDSCDIDIIVETTHSIDDSPYTVLYELEKAIRERSCYKSTRIQTHSVGVDMANFHLDVVPLAKDEDGLLYIGSRTDGTWKRTDPKGHISWSTEVNQGFDNNYKPLVKIMKWWRREHCPSWVKFPKGITLEKMIADNLPEAGLNIEERVMQTMANLATAYVDELESHGVPFIEDPAISGNNLAAKYQHSDFSQFVEKLNQHLTLLAENGTSNDTWKTILGDNFPTGDASAGSMSLVKAMSQCSCTVRKQATENKR